MNKIINSKEDLIELARKIKSFNDPISVDTETTGLFPIEDKIVGWSLAFSEEEGYYVPVNHRYSSNIPEKFSYQLFQLLQTKKLLWHNALYDLEMIKTNFDLSMPVYADTQAMAYLACFPELALKKIIKAMFHYDTKEFDELLSEKYGKQWHSQGYTSADLTSEEIYDYAIHDVLYTYKLFNLLKDEMADYKSIWKLELNLIPIVAKMNLSGISIDAESLKKMCSDALEDSNDRLLKLREVGGASYEPNSVRQTTKILYEDLGLPILKRTKTGSPSTDKEVLDELADMNPFAKQLKEYRSFNKYISGYLKKIPEIVEHTEKLYASFKAIGAESGRFTCPGVENSQGEDRTVNLQNQPVDERFDVRSCYIAPEGWTWVKCDYKQQEYRMMCNIAGETNAIQQFRDGVDFHTMTAKMMLEIPQEQEITRDQRQIGKVLNFGISYGMTIPTIAKKTNHTEEEAKQLYDKYFESLPKLKQLINWASDQVREHKMIKTYFGRVRKLDYENLPRKIQEDMIKKGFNTMIQGSCADITKIAILRVQDRVLSKYDDTQVKLLLQVHDELDFIVRNDMLEEIIPKIKNAMTIVTPSEWCDFDVDVEIGPNWSEKSHEDWNKDFVRDSWEGWGKVVPERYQTYLTDPEYIATW